MLPSCRCAILPFCTPVNWKEMALVGRVARAHGIRGQVIVNLETDFPDERFQSGGELFVERGGAVEALRIRSVRFQQGRPVLGIDGVDSMTEAESKLVGRELRVPVERLAPLPADTFYRHDLIGCRVELASGEAVGLVKDVEGTVTGSRLVVEGRRGEILIPLAREICTAIEPGSKRIVVAPPDGLIELNARAD